MAKVRSGRIPPTAAPLPQGTAFVSVQLGEQTWLVDLPVGAATVGSQSDCEVLLASDQVLARHAALSWDGEALTVKAARPSARVFVNGKPLDGPAQLLPGDEISIGPAVLIAGVSSPTAPRRRRALTHQEFRERLVEQLAGVSRYGRPLSLAMIRSRAGEGGALLSAALDTFRTGDLVASFAPDHAEVLFPETAGEVASAVAERAIRNAGVEGWSLGMASAPVDGDDPDRLVRTARIALHGPAPRGTDPLLPVELTSIAEDPAWQKVLAKVRGAARLNEPALLLGEANTGKRLLARRLHSDSARAGEPFEAISCALVAADSAKSAVSSALAKARGGVLFLDDIGKLAAAGQTALREAIDRGPRARVVASSRFDLSGLARRGTFDAALLQKLEPGTIRLPALRERPADIVPLALFFARDFGISRPRLTPGALARLRTYSWPGNLLELCNAMDRAVLMAGDGDILAEHLPGGPASVAEEPGRLREHVDYVERDAIARALAEANYNQTHAAKRLGLSRRALIYKMEKYGLKPPPGLARRR